MIKIILTKLVGIGPRWDPLGWNWTKLPWGAWLASQGSQKATQVAGQLNSKDQEIPLVLYIVLPIPQDKKWKAINAKLIFGSKTIKEKRNKTQTPPHKAILGQGKEKKQEREKLWESKKQTKSSSLFLSKPLGLYTHTLKKTKISSKEEDKQEERKDKQGERRREEEGRPSKPFNLQNHHQKSSLTRAKLPF